MLRELIQTKGFVRRYGRTLTIWVSLGFLVGILATYLQRQTHLDRWRNDQQRIASIEIQCLLQIVALELNHSSERDFDLDAPPETIRDAIGSFAHGDVSWEISQAADHNGAPDAARPAESVLSAGQSTDMHFQWSVEPTNFVRLKIDCHLNPSMHPLERLVVLRRFSQADTLADGPEWLSTMSVWPLLGFCVGLFVCFQRHRRSQMQKWLVRWTTSIRNGTLRDPNNFEPLRSAGLFDEKVTAKIVATTEDLSQTIQRIEASSEQSVRVLSTMPIGVFSFSPDLKLIYVNRAGCSLLNVELQTPVGRSLIEIFRQPTIVNLVQNVQTDNTTLDAELEDSTTKQVLRLRAYPLEVDSALSTNSSCAVLLTVIDETRLKQLENARRDFTANVSHELKTPLSAIKAYAETLLMGAIDDPDANHRFVERISEQANRLDQLIRDLLHLTRLQSQPDHIKIAPIKIFDLIDICVEEHRTIGTQKKISIECNVPDSSQLVLGDHESIRTIISNLLSNAVRYTNPGGAIQVSTRNEGNDLVLAISDNGIGIPPEDLDRIFERFYRVDKARTQDAGGTGLGLAIVKHLIQLLGGKIRVTSRLGVGSTFEVRLRKSENMSANSQ